jgi:hypothetical protein
MKLFAVFIVLLGIIGLATAMPSYFPYNSYFFVFGILLVLVNLIIAAAD